MKSKIIMINDHLAGFIDLKINNIMAGTSFIIIYDLWSGLANHPCFVNFEVAANREGGGDLTV